jgi:hypothetical protein
VKTTVFTFGVIAIAVFASGQTTTAPSGGLPWTMGVKGKLQSQGDSIEATDVFLNVASTCNSFAGTAILSADRVVIAPGKNARERDMELTGNVHLRYTLLHD